MQLKKTRVLLTGAGGNMGFAALQLFVKPENQDRYELVVFDLLNTRNQKKFETIENARNLQIVWGDLTNYDDVLQVVNGADYILHAAALIPPEADHHPDKAWAVNVGAVENIVKAIKAQPDPNAVKLVSIGSVAQTGDRLPPIHVGRTGDPIMPSVFDLYGAAKAQAERIVADSDLKYWVSLRQTFITVFDVSPKSIMFHPPLNSCFEICTVETAGKVLFNVVNQDLPEEFWRRFYNIGGGSNSRVTFYEFLKATLNLTGINGPQDVYQRDWFATRNFHCHWFEDSSVLEEYLHHQGSGFEEYIQKLGQKISFGEKLISRLLPKSFLKNKTFRPFAEDQKDSPHYWVTSGNHLRIKAFFKSINDWEQIPDWDQELPEKPNMENFIRLDHGYDESKPTKELSLEDMRGAAEFRGGECFSEKMVKGEMYVKLVWGCAFGHQFIASPNLILKGGHWCPECAPPGWNFDEQAKISPFVAQVWHVYHDKDENNVYPKESVFDIAQ